jgi:aminomethyltransferase
MVAFAGWEMPVQYTSIVEEHRAVRGAVGVFDVSHMGEFEVEGPEALAALQYLTTNDVAVLDVGQVQYSLLCTPSGGIVDDLTVYRLAPDRFMLTVNAANIAKDWAWVTAEARGFAGARWRDVSEATALLAVQGPRAEAVVGRLSDVDVGPLGYYRFVRGRVAGVPALISRTGYTGEDGFELYVEARAGPHLWQAVLAAGAGEGIRPVGLGARDTLRLEVRYLLYGQDMDETTNPIEAGLGWVVKAAKGEFVGREAIERVRGEGPRRRLVGLVLEERAIARHGAPVVHGGRVVGRVTSGSYGPSVDRSIALAYVESALSAPGTELGVEIRGRVRAARVVRTPFYAPRVKKS